MGENYRLGEKDYALKPMLLGKYDVLRSVAKPASEFDQLVKDLPRDFKTVARTELYRKSSGWIEKGKESRSFKEIVIRGRSFIVPVLSKPCVGVDTSDSGWKFICVACFDDSECGYAYLDRHLCLPKAKEPVELKWRKLNAGYRQQVTEHLPALLEMSADAILIVKTNALVSPEEKLVDIFVKLVDGSFSGYEGMQNGKLRAELKNEFFELTNETPIHCDADFSPLSTDKIVRQLVKTLAGDRSFTPFHVGLRSEESHPIQITDIICGATKTLIEENRESEARLKQIPFNNKLKGKDKDAKVFYWRSKE